MIKKAISSLIAVEFVGKILSFAIIVIVAKYLGAVELGYWSYTTAINAFLVIASSFGLDIYAMVVLSKDLHKIPYVFTNVFIIRGLLFSIIFICLLLFSYIIEPKVFYLLFMVFVGNFLVSLVPVWFFQVQEDFGTIAKLKFIYGASYFLIALFLLFSMRSIYALAIAYVVAGMIIVALFGGKVFNNFRLEEINTYVWMKILKMGVYLGSALFLNQIYINTDKIMITHMLDKASTGYYEAGYKIYFIITVALGAIWTVYAPKVAKERNFFKQYALITLIVGILYALGLLIFGSDIVFFVYNNSYIQTANIMQYFAISVAAITLSNIFSAPLPLFHKERQWFAISLVSMLLNVGFNFWLIGFYGIVGAIVATIVAELFTALGSWWVLREELAL